MEGRKKDAPKSRFHLGISGMLPSSPSTKTKRFGNLDRLPRGVSTLNYSYKLPPGGLLASSGCGYLLVWVTVWLSLEKVKKKGKLKFIFFQKKNRSTPTRVSPGAYMSWTGKLIEKLCFSIEDYFCWAFPLLFSCKTLNLDLKLQQVLIN